MKLRDVFVPGGMPSITYIEREALELEKKLKIEISEGYKVICVTGPTKSGKTVLAKKVLVDRSCTVNGGQVTSIDGFWNILFQELEIASSETHCDTASAGVNLGGIVQLNAGGSSGSTATFDNSGVRAILSHIRHSNLSLVVDDFHYMPEDVQRDVVRALKSEIFYGLVVLLIAVPHRAFDAIGVEREMEGRFANVDIPTWELSELSQIAEKGFPNLGMTVPASVVETLSTEAIGSPLLMQRFCSRLCSHFNVEETLDSPRDFLPTSETLDKIFEGVARQVGYPTFSALERGPQRTNRQQRRLRDGTGEVDIYQAILLAVAKTGPKEKLHYNEISDELRNVLHDGDRPQRHEVSLALGQMSKIAKKVIKGEPVLEWVDDHLYITDPFLLFYMRWQQRTT